MSHPPSLRERAITSADGTTIAYRTTGDGPGLILVGGTLRTCDDYLPLAHGLAGSFTVHVVERRGRGASGPQGPHYTLANEVEDVLAVQAETGARLAFGHSYGGLALLETARTHPVFERIVAWEPGVPVAPVPTGWIPRYRELLAVGDPYGAFACFIRGSGGAPAFMTKVPGWYLRLVLRMAFHGETWRRMLPLLECNAAEHEQIAAQHGRLAGFADVSATVLLLCGGRSKAAHRAEFATLSEVLPHATLETLPGLNHLSPSERKAAPAIAGRALRFFL
ncbi:alpha/beta hydrolase [Nonomuraea sp. FMUSA5-5]|uniref:Alpha/beta hydrolase n=1 Tax=Nonomuraea composti TaxID=2720023 RepID=A0ABX1B637_9ACTN|nr:alpha/beta hydrolase [Nonomuraea sp. FMUSA5-5]NJP91902.1 alpha/beta hydrolase [Nonomuraea sp. FMUSA5-5]